MQALLSTALPRLRTGRVSFGFTTRSRCDRSRHWRIRDKLVCIYQHSPSSAVLAFAARGFLLAPSWSWSCLGCAYRNRLVARSRSRLWLLRAVGMGMRDVIVPYSPSAVDVRVRSCLRPLIRRVPQVIASSLLHFE